MINVERLRYLLDYDPYTGVFTRKNHAGKASRVVLGSVAGFVNSDGYVIVGFDGKKEKAHRLAWVYVHGFLPDEIMVDHKDGNPSNNRIDNLRLATGLQNNHNRKLQKNNSSGVKGVNWCKSVNKYTARVRNGSERHYLGVFDTVEEAERAIRVFREEVHGEFSRHS